MPGFSMRGKALFLGGLAAGVFVLAGCYHEKYAVKVKHGEDYVIPPNSPQFDQPPEAEYRRPPVKTKDKNMMGGMPSSMGSTGMGGR